MKIKNRIITIVIALILTAITCIPIFAETNSIRDFIGLPNDIGNQLTIPTNNAIDTLGKMYISVRINNLPSSTQTIVITYSYKGNTETLTDSVTIYVPTNGINSGMIAKSTWYAFIFMPSVSDNTNLVQGNNVLYIPVYYRNANIVSITGTSSNVEINIYESTSDESTIAQEAYTIGFNAGYNDGYNEGFIEGQGIEQYTNLTGYVTQLLTQFVGSDAAQYITPIAIVLVILFVYFLFIRFLLSLIKAKGVIKTCDIVMVVASILLLVVMYAPMLNITINKNIRTDAIETTESTQVRRTEYIYDEYGRIIAGPGGTINYEEVESTTSEQEQTEVEVTTQPLEKEITTYEETNDNNIRS